MGQKANKSRLLENEAMAKVRNIRTSPQKLNLVAQSIRGVKADKAVASLSFSRKRIANDVKKTLQTALANAENNHGLDVDKLFVKEAFCGKQVIMKRFRARAKGRAAPIIKPYSNLTIILSEKNKALKKEEKHGSKS